ncbi:hypothetical protein QZH41_003425 [Actinostola sp. cb2023]|nr:hypothetical protein QZH41_003425 [Actinostola sp. cb2023]
MTNVPMRQPYPRPMVPRAFTPKGISAPPPGPISGPAGSLMTASNKGVVQQSEEVNISSSSSSNNNNIKQLATTVFHAVIVQSSTTTVISFLVFLVFLNDMLEDPAVFVRHSEVDWISCVSPDVWAYLRCSSIYVGERIVRMLLDKGAIVSSKDKHDRTALSYASMSGKEKIVKILLEDIEYDINAQDDEGNTPLMYTAMSGNATALKYVLEVLLKYRLSVDLRNAKGFSAYLLAAKMGHFYCAHILKTEGYASDGIRDTEYFLSDKEWIEKVRKEIAKMQVKEKETRLVSYRSTPGRDSTMARPHTSVDFQRIQSNFNGPTESSYFLRPRAGTRLTTRSEPPVRLHKYNSWINTEERAARTGRTSASSLQIPKVEFGKRVRVRVTNVE